REEIRNVALTQERAVHRPQPAGQDHEAERVTRQACDPDLGSGLDDLSGDGRPHRRRPRRSQARARLHQREHGRAQAWRVRTHPPLPWPWWQDRTEQRAERNEMEVMARSKYIRRAPRKARLVADSVRGLRVIDALAQLEFSPRHAAADVAKAIRSAAANAEHNHSLTREDLWLKQ